MKTNILSLYKKLSKERKILEAARIQLKTEFVGIDDVIDRILDLTSTWYLLPEMQMRPLIINLWGLTGTGKTSLVKRLAELIRLDNQCFIYDMKDDNKTLGLDEIVGVIKHSDDARAIIVLDEFQHLGQPRRHPDGIWDLLDSGILNYNSYPRSYFRLANRVSKLEQAMHHGVKVHNGRVVHGIREYKKFVHDRFDTISDEGNPWFYPEGDYYDICELAPEIFPLESIVNDHLSGFDARKTIAFLKTILVRRQKPEVLDCSRSLIFVLGNLDEAYTMTKDFNPDINPDDFHRLSKKISISHIKQALLSTDFRSEQISRLGNNHIIYPAFSSISYYRIIELGLKRVAKDMFNQCGLTLRFDNSIHKLIFKEGVYPTQGARPVLSTIHQIVSSKLGNIVAEVVFEKLTCKTVLMLADSDEILIRFMKGRKIVHTIRVKQQLNLESLRKNRQDDFQAICAVHESGHATVLMILLRLLPGKIHSVTADSSVGGFITSSQEWNYTSREEVLNQLAMMLGGYAAEKMVFGNKHMTSGSESDLARATKYASYMLKSGGMGSSHVVSQTNTQSLISGLKDYDHRSDIEIRELLEKAMKLAEDTLKSYEPLLLNMASYLADHTSMDKNMARSFLIQCTSGNEAGRIINNGALLFYRDALMKRFSNINIHENHEAIKAQLTPLFSLNIDAGQK
jgi:cell division protease FtsH